MSTSKCPDCAGDKDYFHLTQGNGQCNECQGTGTYQDLRGIGEVIPFCDGDCEECSGTGQCQTCGGEGVVYD